MHAVRVGERDRLADAFEDAQPLGKIGKIGDVRAQRPAAHELHHIEQTAVGEPADIVNRRDAWMLQPRQYPGLDAQPLLERRVDRVMRHFDRNVAIQFAVRREVHRRHAAAADLLERLVAAAGKLRPACPRPKAPHRAVRKRRHSTSTPNNSRASRAYSASLPQRPRSASSARVRNVRRTCAR